MDITLIILIASLVVALAGVVFWVYQILSRPGIYDPSPAKGYDIQGILYAFTLGMLPWKKESARLHWLVYLRGIFFHFGIFTGIIVLLLSIFNVTVPGTLGLVLNILIWIGIIAGTAAIISRAADPMLRGLSHADDYISPVLIVIFMLASTLYLTSLLNSGFYYIATSILCIYLPWSKVRHCVYFFFLRGKIGAMAGHRGLLMTSGSHSLKETR